ncbi:hypothetical protein ACC861_37475, partial [Rhizobium ruizarguesonis]
VAQWLHTARRRLTAGKDLADLSHRLTVKVDIECAFPTMPAGLKKPAGILQLPLGFVGFEKETTNVLVIRCIAENPERRLLRQDFLAVLADQIVSTRQWI